MKRYSVVYLFQQRYHQIDVATYDEAVTELHRLSTIHSHKPIGIYDAKTELFTWEPSRQQQYDTSTIERQGRLGSHMIDIAQQLRAHLPVGLTTDGPATQRPEPVH